MEAFEIKSDVPVMKFCEFCYATLNENGTCPTEGCIHNDLMELDEVNEKCYQSSIIYLLLRESLLR